jgi:hypothetical protein
MLSGAFLQSVGESGGLLRLPLTLSAGNLLLVFLAAGMHRARTPSSASSSLQLTAVAFIMFMSLALHAQKLESSVILYTQKKWS